MINVLESTVTCVRVAGSNNDEDSREPCIESLSDMASPICEASDRESRFSKDMSAGNNACQGAAKNMYDPGNWEHMALALRDVLVEKRLSGSCISNK